MRLATAQALLLFLFCVLGAQAGADEGASFDLVRRSGGTAIEPLYKASSAIRVGDILELSSTDGYEFDLTVSKTTLSNIGNRIIHAFTDGGGRAIIVLNGAGGTVGSITEFGERYRIHTSASGQRLFVRAGHVLEEQRIDDGVAAPQFDLLTSERLTDLKEEEPTPSSFRVMKADQPSDVIYPTYKAGSAKISVLMYYDDSMSNPLINLDFITQVANEAYSDSGAGVEIEIVGTKALDIDDDVSHRDLKSAMESEEPPFQNIQSDRSFFSADLVYLVRASQSPDGEDPCGTASVGVFKQRHYRNAYTGLVQTERTDDLFCSDYTFAHEVGHNLGARHNREDYTEEGELPSGAYSYSHGRTLDGVFRTVMGVSGDTSTPRLGLFSSPNLACNGYVCGKPASDPDSSDNVSTFHSTGNLVASYEGEFTFEAVFTYAARLEERSCSTSDGVDGYFRGIYLSNQSAFPIEVISTHFGRPDGTYFVSDSERVVEPGVSSGRGFCREAGADPVMGTTYDKAFMRYLHPGTGQTVETAVHEWDAGYEGDYRGLRVASGDGGTVSGNPSQSVRVGSSHTFDFTPDSGYTLTDIQSNCSGSRSGNSYTVEV